MMSLHFNCSATFLFDEWTITSCQHLGSSCLAIFVSAFLFEGLKSAREMLTARNRVSQLDEHTPIDQSNNNLSRQRIPHHLAQTFLHMVQTLVTYLFMLLVMTFNLWVLISVVVGSGLGYLAFSLGHRADHKPECRCK